jgi:hypothetical protein
MIEYSLNLVHAALRETWACLWASTQRARMNAVCQRVVELQSRSTAVLTLVLNE